LLQLGADLDERVAITVERGTRYLRAGADLVFVLMLVDTP
jgi:2-methylisocitrate lyase-like PEP mutase family enzyme